MKTRRICFISLGAVLALETFSVRTAYAQQPITGTGSGTTTGTGTTTTTTTTTTTPPDPRMRLTDPGTTVPPTVITPPIVTPPEPPRAAPLTMHDFLDTRLTWTFGDDDVLTATGQRVPVSPLPRIGDRQQYQLFFDALNSRFAGRENLTHLVMYGKAPGFIPNLDTEASLVLRFDLTALSTGSGNLNQALYDAGTFLRLFYKINPQRATDGISLTLFPFDTDRFRLGYLWDLSWGGNDVFPRRVGPAPGGRLGFDYGPFSAYLGLKTASIVVPLEVVTQSADIEVVRVEETQYAMLGGAGVKIGDIGRADISGGYFQQGRFDFPGVRGRPVFLYGGSARILFSQGLPATTSLDMQLYRNDPNAPMQFFRLPTYTPGQIGWLISGEVNVINQQLADIESPGQTVMQPGFAAAVQGRLQVGYFSAGVTGLYRDVPFLLRNVPSFIPFYAIPKEASVFPELFFAVNADVHIPVAHLTPAIIIGVQSPATFSTKVTEGSLEVERTLVIRRAGNFSILPPGEPALPIISARFSLRWDLSTIFGIMAWVQYTHDTNATLLTVDTSGARTVRIAQAPDQLGLGLAASARY